jgi:hypothetical protein
VRAECWEVEGASSADGLVAGIEKPKWSMVCFGCLFEREVGICWDWSG